jgi:hypothetical protein
MQQQGATPHLLLLLQTKATKPKRATAKCLCISAAWAEEIRFLSAASLQEGSLVGQRLLKSKDVRSPLSYKGAIQMAFALPKLRRLKSGGYWRVNAFEKPKRNARAQILSGT